jgi:hypothetical protein
MTATNLPRRATAAILTPWALGCAVALVGCALTTPRPPVGLPLLIVVVLSALTLAGLGALRLLIWWAVLTLVVGLTWTAAALLLSWTLDLPAVLPGLLVLGLQVGAALTALGLLGQAGLSALDAHTARGGRERLDAPGDDRLPAALRGLRPDDPDVW